MPSAAWEITGGLLFKVIQILKPDFQPFFLDEKNKCNIYLLIKYYPMDAFQKSRIFFHSWTYRTILTKNEWL